MQCKLSNEFNWDLEKLNLEKKSIEAIIYDTYTSLIGKCKKCKENLPEMYYVLSKNIRDVDDFIYLSSVKNNPLKICSKHQENILKMILDGEYLKKIVKIILYKSDLSPSKRIDHGAVSGFVSPKSDFVKEISSNFKEIIKNSLKDKVGTISLLRYLEGNNLIANDKMPLHDTEVNSDHVLFGILVEALLTSNSIFSKNENFIFKHVIEYLKGSVAYSFACMGSSEEAVHSYFLNIINNKQVMSKIKNKNEFFNGIIGNAVDVQTLFQSSYSLIDYKNDTKIINGFEIDFLSQDGYVIEIKSSSKSYDSIWFYQLLMYFFLLKQKKNDFANPSIMEDSYLIKGIGIYNPIISTFWKINVDEIIDVVAVEKWLIDNEVI